MTSVPAKTIDLLNKIQKYFLWGNKNPKIKHDTLCNNYENGGLKSVDIFAKIVSIQCSWIKRLFDSKFHQWKLIPLYLFHKYLGKNFKFHSSLDICKYLLKKFTNYYQEIVSRWSRYLSSSSALPSAIACQFLWYNRNIKIGNESIYIHEFSEKGLILLNIFLTLRGTLSRRIA